MRTFQKNEIRAMINIKHYGEERTVMSKNKNELTIHSSAAEYLTYVAATGDNPESFEMRLSERKFY